MPYPPRSLIPAQLGAYLTREHPEAYELEIYREISSTSDDPLTKYELIEYIPATRKRIRKLEWTYQRPGGCATLRCELQMPYDSFGLDFRTRTIQHFQHVVLRVRGIPWWCGTVESVASKLGVPETVSISARGYARQAEKANISWTYSRQSLKSAGDVGELAGIVRSMWLYMPLLMGTQTGFPNPLADTLYAVASAARPRGLVFDNVSVWEVIEECAMLAGNYDWGVDENRQFYFVPPETMTSSTSVYTQDAGLSQWSDDEADGVYGDETYFDPDPLPETQPVEEQGTFVLGNNLVSLEPVDSVESSKNVLKIIAPSKIPGGQPQIITVADSEWLTFWGRRLTTKVATSFFSEEADVRRWGERRLKLLGPPQTEGSVRAVQVFAPLPIHPLGAARIINPADGSDIKHRIQGVRYAFEKDDHLSVTVELAYQIPPDQYFAEQLRRDATISQNSLVGERTPFILSERMRWHSDAWTVTLT